MLKGSSASAGIGIGSAVLIRQDKIIVVKRTITDQAAEKQRFSHAVEQFSGQMRDASEEVGRSIGEEEAAILSAQVSIIRDPELSREVFALIDGDRVSAEYAFSVVCDRYISLFDGLEDELMRARAADFRDIKARLLSILLDLTKVELQKVPTGSVLVAEEITPSQAAMLRRGQIAGIVTQAGTRFSHVAIIARALGIPAVVSLDNALGLFSDGDELIVDGNKGEVLRNPPDVTIQHYRQRQQRELDQRRRLLIYRERETRTLDGQRVELSANLAVLPELSAIAENNVDGIGLFRTEFLYMDSRSAPGEEEQYRAYARVLRAMNRKPVVIRTLDVGGDKNIPYLGLSKEDNPFLGFRAVRFTIARTDIFKTQLAALLRASVHGNLKIMLPMISSITELREVQAVLAEVRQELTAQSIPYSDDVELGIMIETPAAALCADQLAREADFFSIGTNDLTQYTLAVDRGNDNVAGLYSTIHPAVLRMIRLAVEGAQKAGIPVSVCGEAAADTRMLPLLIGLGVRKLSVSPGAVLAVRQRIDQTDAGFWQIQIDHILNMQTPGEISQFVTTHLRA